MNDAQRIAAEELASACDKLNDAVIAGLFGSHPEDHLALVLRAHDFHIKPALAAFRAACPKEERNPATEG